MLDLIGNLLGLVIVAFTIGLIVFIIKEGIKNNS